MEVSEGIFVSPDHGQEQDSMSRKHVYLLLAVIGFTVSYYFFISFLEPAGPRL